MVRYYRGEKYPVMCLQERLLMVLACKYVDDIVIEAPYIITEDLVRSLNIHKVVNVVTDEDQPLFKHANVDQFEVVRSLGIYHEIAKNNEELTIEKIAMRVQANKAELEKKFARKAEIEQKYYE